MSDLGKTPITRDFYHDSQGLMTAVAIGWSLGGPALAEMDAGVGGQF